ncbi:glutaminyl-peptide cyclotransferase [Mesorhizobium sp. NBSH29]|uniref:glutaminyl-peptide cyclotransferase n=1 Tax=Mesorhizobium sp. NBSH29 TaxID=2654249 RepID=UPI0018968A31|nr:glutaminyl-peptide cyclotransferase [Mesorhizobium sp. NBSH29]QPC88045.1 glutaminyl-peptide cyclotransferase [Mesorhizobium sp. NBSH29]
MLNIVHCNTKNKSLRMRKVPTRTSFCRYECVATATQSCHETLMRLCHSAFVIVLSLPLSAPPAAARECPVPEQLDFVVDKKIDRSERGLTQGLEFHDGKLYESTGRALGDTRINMIDLDGTVTALANLGDTVFGEGLTILNGEVFQLTWQENIVFVYDLEGNLLRQMPNPYTGWGLASDGEHLLFTDGEGQLRFADPKTFEITREIELRTAAGVSPVWMNELEYVDGKLYGNIFTSDWIIRVDPQSGCVEAVSDMAHLRSQLSAEELAQIADSPENVLNGIARDPQSKKFYITGKRWPMIFVGDFRQQGTASQQ